MDQLEELKSRVAQHRGDLPSLADEAEVSLSWLSKFLNGRIGNPTLGSVTRLNAALSAREHGRAAA